jgi:hypothetical protein
MSDKPSSNDNPNLLKQGLILILILLIVPGVFFFIFVFPLFKNSQEKDLSPAQALTVVAQMSQTAQARGEGSPEQSSPTAHSAVSTPTPRPSFSPIQRTPTRTPQTVATTGGNNSSSTTNNGGTTQNNTQPTATFPVSNVTVRPTYTPKPTETPRPKDTATPTPTATATPSPGLLGLSMNNVINRFQTEKGFTCKQEGSTTDPVLWMCDIQNGNDLWYHVDIYGTSKVEVSNLLVSVFQTYPDDEKSIDIIGFAASLPYTGSNASEARQWVEQTLPDIQSVDDVREKFIGGVRFKLYGDPQGRYLEMGDPVQQ